ncbi:MAG: pyridoxal-dependent decarboxylase, exosortase A system-associated, partial [Thiohalomonadales bacterium]
MKKTPPVHEKMDKFSVVDNCLMVGGTSLTKLAAQVGQTPFYAYDSSVIKQQVMHFRQYIPADIKLHYAIKANPMPAVVQFLSKIVDGFDLASTGEMKVALDTGMSPEFISFAGPGKQTHDLASAIAAGVTINLESEAEFHRALNAADKIGIRPK